MIEILRDLVAIDSVNPSLVAGGAGESEIARYIAHALQSMGIDASIEEAAPGRPNVIGVIEGRAAGRTLMLCGHSDTVGVEGMATPFDPVERDGKLFGRGAQDMKGGVAAILGAAQRLTASPLRAGRVIVAIVADEEYASIGAEALVRKWSADAAVVTEPTDLVVGVAHKGFEWVEITTEGVAAHGSRPDDGVDAIVRMGRVLSRYEQLDRTLAARPHPLLGRPSLHASLIAGGRELSTYPDRCTLHLERRTVDGERAGIALEEAESILAQLRNDDATFAATARLLFTRASYVAPADFALLPLLGAREQRAMSFWTDAAILGAAGIPSIVFGPGGAGLHGIDEYVRTEEVRTCADALVALAAAFCGEAA